MQTKKFEPVIIRPAANGVIVEPIGEPGAVRNQSSIFVFNTWDSLAHWLRAKVENARSPFGDRPDNFDGAA